LVEEEDDSDNNGPVVVGLAEEVLPRALTLPLALLNGLLPRFGLEGGAAILLVPGWPDAVQVGNGFVLDEFGSATAQ
jgi:hypothetical protein